MYTKLFPANVKREGTLAEHISTLKNMKTMTGFMSLRIGTPGSTPLWIGPLLTGTSYLKGR